MGGHRCVTCHKMLRRWFIRFPGFVRRYSNEDIFEPYQEYTSPPPPPPLTSLSTLHNLLKTLTPSTYPTTRTLLLDLLSPSIALPIPPSPLFLSAALMAFHPSLPLSTPARIHDFTLWFTYYPPLHPAPLSLLHTHLKSRPQTSLPFYTTLSLLLARKGYISFSNTHLLPSISRYSPSNFLEFYHTYESSIHSYFSTLKSPTGLRKTLSITRSIAIRFLAEAGHLSVAVSLLSPQYALHPKSHSILLSRLLAAPPSPTRDLHIAKLRSTTRRIHTKWNSPRKQSNTPKETETLRYISRALLSPDPRNFPSTNDLVSFFSLYISLRSPTSSRNAITLLHTHTLRLSPIPLRAISHLLFAHMVLLFRLGTRSPSPTIPSLGPRALRALLDLFLKHFHIHGVSVPTMLQYTSTTTIEDSSDSSDSDSSSFYLSTLSSLPTPTSPYPLLPKLFPSRLHISLIWQSLAHLAPSHHALIELYNELIHYASPQPQSQQIPSSNLQTPKSWTSRGHRLPSTPTPYPPLQWHSHAHPSPIIAECFTPFIIKLMHASTYPTSPLPSPSPTHPNTHIRSPSPTSLPTSLPSPTSILRTLLSLSLSPTIYHYTEMARWWAWQGHESKVWIVLDRLESEGGGVALERGGQGQGEGGGGGGGAGVAGGESKGGSVGGGVEGRSVGGGQGRGTGTIHKDHQVLHAITSEDSQNHQNHQNHENPPPPPPLPLSPAPSPSPSPSSNPNPNHTPLPPPDLPFYIALMRAFLSSPNYSSLSPPSSSPTPSPSFSPSPLSPLSPSSLSSSSPLSLSSSLPTPTPSPSPNLPPYPPTSPYPGTLRRLSALSRLWAHMELRFGRAYLLEQLGISTGIGSGIGSGGGGTRGVRGVGSGGTGVGSASGTGTGRRSGGSGSPRVEDDDTVDEDHGDRDDDAPTSTSTSTLTPHTPNPYLSKAVSNWRALAGIPSPRTSSSIPSPRTLSSIPPRSHERRT
ncbi:hypothetical protein HHX47_DHR6000573 [Lentinula edodes]|nr:hypothetical protein HHX47_DHR6000573 [Lentinula edodes]